MRELPQYELRYGTDDQPATGASVDALAGSLDIVRGFLRRHWKLVSLALLLGLLLGAVSLVLLPVRYEATALLLIDQQRLRLFQHESVISDPTIETYTAIEGQMEILKSDFIAKGVIQRLGLEKDADFTPPKMGPGALLAALGFHEAAPLTEAQRERYMLDAFAKLRTVNRVGAALAIEIGFKSHSAELAAAVANAICDEYVNDTRSGGRTVAREASEWLHQRLSELRTQMAQADQAVTDFRATHDIVDIGGKQVVSQQIAEISSQLTSARSQLSDASARLQQAQAMAREFAISPTRPAMQETLNNPLTNKQIEQYLELSNREAEYASRFGEEHNATLRLRQRKEEAKAGLLADLQRLSEAFANEKAVFAKHVQDLEDALKAAIASARSNEKVQIKLRELDSSANSYRALYDSLLQRHSEAMLQQELPNKVARILSPATEPLSKPMKKSLLRAALVVIGTTGLGVAFSLLRDLQDRTFRTSDDVEHRLNTNDFIGMIPTWRLKSSENSGAGRALVKRDPQKPQSKSAFWAFMLSPASAFTEAIARVRVAILRQASVNDSKIIGFTSVLPNEGASTIAAAVVQSFAQSGRSVILVDLDFRHPELTREFAPEAKVGLQEVLLGEAMLDEVIWRLGGFAFIPGVLDDLKARPEELLESPVMAAVLLALRERYDYVIVDLPPMFPMLDVSMTDRTIESYVLIIEWGASKIDTVAHALARCPGVRKRMLGFVLNKVDFNRLRQYDPRSDDYYDARRYAKYYLKEESG
jgi:succinoglycan biosynthesis transport protein ExoP